MGTANKKSAFNARVHAEKRWDQYLHHREALRHELAGKVPDRDIWKIASFSFQPLNGQPHEVDLTPAIRNLLDFAGATPAAAAEPVDSLDDFFIDGDVDAPADVEPAPPPPPIQPPPLPKDDTGWTIYARNIGTASLNQQQKAAEEDKIWAKLAYEMDRTKRCPILETADWIYHHLGTPPELISPENVPSPGALWHLRTLKENPAAAQEFLKTWMVKTIPDKKQMDFESKRSLGSMKIYKQLDAFDEQFAEKAGAA